MIRLKIENNKKDVLLYILFIIYFRLYLKSLDFQTNSNA